MTAKSLSERVAELERKVGGKTIEEQFREQAELIDRLFTYRFDEFEKKLDTKFDAKLEEKLEQKLEQKLQPIRSDIALIKNAVITILGRLN